MSERKLTKDNNIITLKRNYNSIALSISFIKWVILGTIVGALTGIAAALFLNSLNLATSLRQIHPWLLFLLPFGGAFVSFLYSKYGKNSSKGNNLILEKINESTGRIPMRMAPLVFLGTFITHLFGGSAGREGTGVQIGSSIAEGIGRLFKLDKIDSRIILMSGISSGFSSVFGTPLAGTIFGMEVVALGTMSYEGLIPCFTAAFVGDFITSALGVHHAHYKILDIPELSYMIVIKIIISAIIFGLISRLFSELTHKLKEIFTQGFENASIKSFLGGILVIILTYIIGSKDYLGLSLPLISDSFTGQVNPFAFLCKILFTSLTLGTGFQGGEVTPLFVIGSTIGNTLSGILRISPSLLAALGLIGVFTGATNTPIASFILGIEMFGSQGLIYVFMTCAISYVFSGHTGIYTSQRIGRSKSRLIEVPEKATLAYYRKKNNKLKDKISILVGQFKFGISSIELPSSEGLNIYKITAKGQGIRLMQRSYNPDGGIWSAKTINSKCDQINLNGKDTEIYAITVYQAYGEKDKIFLVNTNLFKDIEIEYVVEQPKHKEFSKADNGTIVDDKAISINQKNKNKSYALTGQFNLGSSNIELPNPKGRNIYKITVVGGKIKFNHNSYNPDGHTWSASPANNQDHHIDLDEGTHTIEVFIEEYFGNNDKILLVNPNFRKQIEVKYSIEQVSEEDLKSIN